MMMAGLNIRQILSVFSSKVRPLGLAKYVTLLFEDLDMIHWYVIYNCDEAQPYLQEHLNSINVDDARRRHKFHRNQFSK
ncbi:hypothetical protein LINPERHAP2_LOCUS15761, partial [Linum perenne]